MKKKNKPYNKDLIEVGNNLARLRSDHGLTAEDLAGIIETDARTISRYENGQQNMSIVRLMQILEALNEPIDMIMPARFSRNTIRNEEAEHEALNQIFEIAKNAVGKKRKD